MSNKKTLRVIAVLTATAAAVSTAAFFIKRHVKKSRNIIFALITAVMVCGMMGATMTAYAYTEPDTDREVDLDEILTPVVTPEPTPPPEPKPLTPDGNLTLVDDISGEQANDKQFITVVTKSGAYFYIVIDRAGDRENVHFLNLVDEADLMAIIEKDKKQTVTPAPVETKPEPTPTPEPTPEPTKNNTGSMLIVILLLAALGGGAAYYIKVIRPKQGAAKNTTVSELDDFDFDEDEDVIPDFAPADEHAPDSEPDGGDLSFDFGDFSAEKPESEGK